MSTNCIQCMENDRAEGSLLCNACLEKNARASAKAQSLVEAGHPRHCAQRIIWDDGECECGLVDKLQND